jgi:glycosyltransferase involved in cell wall biosynthesis
MQHLDRTSEGAGPAAAPLLSVITVSLNAEETIGDTIASVDNQQAAFDIEHICVDGGSSDATRGIIDRWVANGSHIRRVYERDRGIYDAMNKGLRIAAGEYILFLNADDFLVSPDTLSMVMDGIESGSADNPELVLGDVSMGRLGGYGFWRHRRVPRMLGRLRGWGLFPVHQGQFTKRSLLEGVGGFDPDLKLSSDVLQYYDIERRFRPTMRRLGVDVAFMRIGGASNQGVRTMLSATLEFYRRLASIHGAWRAAAIVVIKTLQSLTEVRIGRCPHQRWFATASSATRPMALDA